MNPLTSPNALSTVQDTRSPASPAIAPANPHTTQAFEQLMADGKAEASPAQATEFKQQFEHGMQMWAIQFVQPLVRDKVKELRNSLDG